MTDKKTEALKLALEALEGLEALLLSMGLTHLIVYGDAEKAITNLQKQLEEQPAQKTCLVANESCKHGSWCSEVYCQEHCTFVEQPAQQEPDNWKDRLVAQHEETILWQAKRIGELMDQTAQQQEPVVWMYQDKSTHQVSFQKHMRAFVDHGATYETPLYTTPPQRKPLTDEMEIQLKRHLGPHRRSAFRDGWRSAELAHGITGEQK